MSDLISRQEAIDYFFRPYSNEESYSNIDIKRALRSLPSAQTERKKGRWERIPFSFAGGYRCSVCGQKSWEKYWHFCPNCGADMRGDDNE